MAPSLAVSIHVAIGSVALLGYWTALSVRKGTPMHRLAGKICLVTLVAVTVTIGPILFTRPGPFDPGWVVQMVYLTVSVVTVSMLAFTAIRFKNSPERFRGPIFRIMGPVMLVLGIVVLAAGLSKADAFAIVVSWVGLVYGSAMIGFARFRGELHPRWWLGWHLNAVSGLFNAVNGTVMFIAAKWIGLIAHGVMEQVSFQILTVVGAIAVRVWFGFRFSVPLRCGPRRVTFATG